MNPSEVKNHHGCSEENCIFLQFFCQSWGTPEEAQQLSLGGDSQQPLQLLEWPHVLSGLSFPFPLPDFSLSPYPQLDFYLPLGSPHVFVTVSSLQVPLPLSSAPCTRTGSHRGWSCCSPAWRRPALCSITLGLLPGNAASHGFPSSQTNCRYRGFFSCSSREGPHLPRWQV